MTINIQSVAANAADQLFTQAYDKAYDIDFQSNWANGTGYFDHAVSGDRAPKVSYGVFARSKDEYGRRILILGTRLGNVVIFDRYGDDRGIFTFNADMMLLRGFKICHTALTEEAMCDLVGDGKIVDNIGQRLEMLQAK